MSAAPSPAASLREQIAEAVFGAVSFVSLPTSRRIADAILALPALREAAAPGTGTCRVCKQQFSTAICSACWVNGEDDAAPAQVDAKVGEAIVEAQEAASAHGYCCRATEILSRHIGVLIAALRARSASPAPAMTDEP